MRTPKWIPRTLDEARKLGWPRTLADVTLRAVNSVTPLKVLRGVAISRIDAAFLKCPDGYTPMFLSNGMLRNFAKDAVNELSEGFLDEAFAKGDECFAIVDGETLAAYGWYSVKPTRIDPPDLFLHFGPKYAYMYKSLTHPRYRGQRLHAIGMTLALQDYQSRGLTGLVSYVEANNFDSLKSCARMGYEVFGTAYVVKIFGRYLQHRSGGCEALGFRVEPSAIPPRRAAEIAASRGNLAPTPQA